MGKILIFSLLYWVTGSPIIALLVILAIYLAVDRTYLGFLPDPVRAFNLAGKRGYIKQEISRKRSAGIMKAN